MNLSVVVPVYNAAAFIEESVRGLQEFLDGRGLSYEIVLADDGSTDGSAAVMRELASERVRVVASEENRGKFAALGDGMAAARGSCRVFTDADVPFDHAAITYIEHLVNERGFHLVIGDRTLPDSRYREELPALRRLTMWLFRQAVRLLVTGGVPDSQCGLKGFRADVAEALFPLLTDSGFGGDVELLYIALKYNLEIRRIPVRLLRQGESTVRPLRHSWAMLGTLARLRRNWKSGAYTSQALAAIASQRYWEAP
ncbi:MAG: glycosyltransferase [Candidatus Brocadiia bacterium]